ncbi:hypothetical protein GGR56DRAFT_647539 [Xylariaceae sp. FL0804]|nr:hypothetical protein GGR56DRAFT_647539 [Xylariaceae sp. FL0804]
MVGAWRRRRGHAWMDGWMDARRGYSPTCARVEHMIPLLAAAADAEATAASPSMATAMVTAMVRSVSLLHSSWRCWVVYYGVVWCGGGAELPRMDKLSLFSFCFSLFTSVSVSVPLPVCVYVCTSARLSLASRLSIWDSMKSHLSKYLPELPREVLSCGDIGGKGRTWYRLV